MATDILSSKADKSSVRYEGRAKLSEIADIVAMEDENAWRVRLAAAIEESGKSKRAISLAAQMAPGYVHGILSEGKDPSVHNLVKVCGVLGVTLSRILFGIDLTPEDQELLWLLRHATPEDRAALMQILRSRTSAGIPG